MTVNDNSDFYLTIRQKMLVFLILAVVTGLLYANSLKNGFFFDDYPELIENASIQHPGTVFQHLSWKGIKAYSQDMRHFRPVLYVFRTVLYYAFRHNPFFYHLTNVLLLLILGFCSFCLFFSITGNRAAALLSALFFCVHPQNTACVNCITCGQFLYFALFCAGMVIFFIRYLDRPKQRHYYVISQGFYFLAVLCHESAVFSFAVVFLAAVYRFDIKTSLKLCVPYALLGASYALLKLWLFSRAAMGPLLDWRVIFVALRLIGWYLKELVLPTKLVFMWGLQADPYGVMAKGSLVLAVMALGFFVKDRMKIFALLWFFSGFLPVPWGMMAYYNSRMGAVIEPGWFMFSSLGFFLFLGLTLTARKGQFPINVIKYLMVVVLMVYWGVWTIRYNDLWSSESRYSRYWLQVVPDNTFALLSLGNDSLRQGQAKQAVFYFKKILDKGDNPEVYDKLGNAYFLMGQFKEGCAAFNKASRLDPKDAFAANRTQLCHDKFL